MTLYDPSLEKCVIGALCINPKKLEEIATFLKPEDFTIKACEVLYTEMLDRFINNDVIDVALLPQCLVAVTENPTQYIADCMIEAPTTNNVVLHAHVVHDAAKEKRLRDEVYEVFDSAEKDEIATSIMEKCKDFLEDEIGTSKTMYDLMNEACDKLSEPAGLRIDTGFPRLDGILKGMWGGNLIIIGARPGCGKAQPLWEKVLTPDGWKTMGDMQVGSKVITADGTVANVTRVTPQGKRKIYKVFFDDLTSVYCDGEHLWEVSTREDRKKGSNVKRVLRTIDMIDSIYVNGTSRKNYRIRLVDEIDYGNVLSKESLNPYVLGVLLGDGDSNNSVRLTNPEQDIIERVISLLPDSDKLTVRDQEKYQYYIARKKKSNKSSGTCEEFKRLGLLGKRSWEKFIPHEYLYADIESRRELLRGLMDTDGCTSNRKSKRYEYCTASQQLANDVAELARSLGCKVTISIGTSAYKKDGVKHQCRFRYRLGIKSKFNLFHCERKKAMFIPDDVLDAKFITDIKCVGEDECQCIAIDHPSRLYVTSGMTLTHNSAYGLDIAESAARKGHKVIFYSLEMLGDELAERLICRRAYIPLDHIIDRTMDDEEVVRYTKACAELSSLPVIYEDTPNITVQQIRAKARTISDLSLIVVDYIGLLKASRKYDSRNLELGAISRELKNLASELRIPIVALAQLNRGRQDDEEPNLSDLRDSGELEQNASKVIFLWNIDKEEGIKGCKVAKNRRGRTGVVQMNFQGEYMRFIERTEDVEYGKKGRRTGYDDL